jgi:type IV secretory pathway VirD2 relaxase
VVVRGRDDLGKDLIISQDYITNGMLDKSRRRPASLKIKR